MGRCCQIFVGTLVVTISILLGWIHHVSRIPSDVHIQLPSREESSKEQQQPFPLLGKHAIERTLTTQQLEDYRRDGFVLIKQLLTKEEAESLKAAATYTSSRNFDVFGLIGSSAYKKIGFDLWRTSSDIASLSLQALPNVAAQLLLGGASPSNDSSDGTSTATTKPFRLLRDAYFAYAPPGTGCGWHVDDEGFFPANKESNGPTFWITLDPLKAEEGGGIAVLNRTMFNAQTESKYLSEEDCLQSIKGATCAMEEKNPECAVKMEASQMVFDMEPGDALVWDRYTFHRGVPATELFPKSNENNDVVSKMRYSVRYIPFGATANGAVHSSVEQGEVFDSPYYPQVWPTVLPHEIKGLENGLDQDITLSSLMRFIAMRVGKKVLPSLYTDQSSPKEEEK